MTVSDVFVFVGIFLCLCLSAFCSAAEMSYSSCSQMRLEGARDSGDKRGKIAVYIIEHFDNALSAILIGNNLANICSSSLASVAVILISGSDEYAWVSTVLLTITVIIFGETIPKITAKQNANKLALKNSYPVRIMMIIFYPLVWLVVAIINLITRGMKDESADTPDEAVEELQSIIETAEDEDVLDEDQSELVQAAIDFSETSAMDVMTARVDVQAIDIEDDWDEILALVEDAPYTRLPVYEGGIDNVIGILYLNHFLKAMADDGHADIRKLLMPPCYVYKTTSPWLRMNTAVCWASSRWRMCLSRLWATSGTRATPSRPRSCSIRTASTSWTAPWCSPISLSLSASMRTRWRPRAIPSAAGRLKCSATIPHRATASPIAI